MNVLVTGGSGFLGTRFVADLLAAGHQVTIFDVAESPRFPALCVRGDVRDRPALSAAAARRDAIVHLAAEHRDDATPAALRHAVNVEGTANVAAAAEEAGCRRIIFTSTSAVYGLKASLATEDSEPRPASDYGRSKLQAEQVLRRWAGETPGASLVILRPCVVFGEGNRGNVFELVKQIHGGRFVMVGSGRNRKSLACVGNLSRFILETLRFPPGFHLLNYADKPDFSVTELVGAIRRGLNARTQAQATKGAAAPRVRLPYWLGLTGGIALDTLSKLTGRTYPITASRIRKFCAETTISTERLARTGFVQPYNLEEALVNTIRFEFGTGEGTACRSQTCIASGEEVPAP